MKFVSLLNKKKENINHARYLASNTYAYEKNPL